VFLPNRTRIVGGRVGSEVVDRRWEAEVSDPLLLLAYGSYQVDTQEGNGEGAKIGEKFKDLRGSDRRRSVKCDTGRKGNNSFSGTGLPSILRNG